jgi:dihydrofolate synthase/folylpolyglutamate synthase
VRTVDIPEAAASVPAEGLAQAARRAGLDAEAAPDIAVAVRDAAALAGPGGRVMICGSLYLAGVVLRANG